MSEVEYIICSCGQKFEPFYTQFAAGKKINNCPKCNTTIEFVNLGMSDNSAQEIKIFTYENMEEIEKFGIIKIPDSDKISFEDLLEFLPEIDGD